MSDSGTDAFVVTANVADLHAAPDGAAEVVSQTILGASVRVLESVDSFRRIATEDRYDGWIAEGFLTPAWDRTDFLQTGIATLFADVFTTPNSQSELITKLTVSTRVCIAHRPEVEEFVPIVLPDHQIGYVHGVCLNMTHSLAAERPDLLDTQTRRSLDVGELKRQVLRAVGRQAAAAAKRFVGTPYLWGGCTPFGLDCSGLVQLVYKLSGLQLRRDAHMQYADRRFVRVDEGQGLEEGGWEPGDLVVFSRRNDRRATHIGLTLGDGRFIHSLGGRGVCIHPCATPQFQETFVGAVRVSPDADLTIEAS